jgi:hypothetical protein
VEIGRGEFDLTGDLAIQKGDEGEMSETDDRCTPAADDAATESAVLQQILIYHPAQVTVGELIRELARDPADFAESDAIERAVRDLTGAGLIHRHDAFVIPTQAALRFNELLDR